jgi:hypothetical protein
VGERLHAGADADRGAGRGECESIECGTFGDVGAVAGEVGTNGRPMSANK